MLHNVCKTKGVGVIAELHAHEALSKSTHPRKFGYHVTVHRTNDRPSAPQVYQCLLWHFVASLGAQEKTDCTSML